VTATSAQFDALTAEAAAPPSAVARTLPHLVVAAAERTRPAVTRWTRRYVVQLVLVDAVCAGGAVLLGWSVRFGFPADARVVGYLASSGVFVAGWLFSLLLAGAYEIQRIGVGAGEYQRLLRAGVNLGGSVAILAYLTHVALARTFLAIMLPAGVVAMMLGRFALRKVVHARRARGEWTSQILAVGTRESVAHLAAVLKRNKLAGLNVIGACVDGMAVGEEVLAGVPVVGSVSNAADEAAHLDADIVAVAGTGLGPRRVRELGWQLEGTGRSMVVAPELTDVAGPRVHVSPVEGLPLMWVDQPAFTGARRVVKRGLDVVGATLLLLVTGPALLAVGLLIRLTSRGPALYRSTRLGEHGRPFTVLKFRTMFTGSDQSRADLLQMNEFEGGILFKIRRDPRVTRLGRILRKLSIDELPQLINVIGGSMSLVGPRPPLPDEVERYGLHVRRRLLVKPGMTGLWQVSGRSDLSWDEAVRLDLYYVENWSLGLDLAIVLRTIWVVLTGRGAY
jgi:exopolysaccharide biosynthesis polyprenyl glycosylphosphotransferase